MYLSKLKNRFDIPSIIIKIRKFLDFVMIHIPSELLHRSHEEFK